MQKLFITAAIVCFMLSCSNNDSVKTDTAKIDSTKTMADSIKTSPKMADTSALSAAMEDGIVIIKDGKVMVTYNGQLSEMSYKEMMMREIETNDKGEIVIVEGKKRIPFKEGMIIDKDDNILMMKDGKMMKMDKEGKWVDK